ncbi:7238_t:CDS:2 [Entrophospora sp. SA101]|nr:16282_t:CDS:2 [Entrophospora sp. SA101]CAJ0756177.1 7238_t:CDS:2 [Entrophospora sp. SA101]
MSDTDLSPSEGAVGYPNVLEKHLARECVECDEEIRKYYLNSIIEKSRSRNNQKKAQDSHYSTSNNKNLNNHQVSLSEFYENFLKKLHPAYQPSNCKKLSINYLNDEVIHVNRKIDQDIEKNKNKTLGSSHTGVFLSDQIESIILEIGVEKLSAIVLIMLNLPES